MNRSPSRYDFHGGAKLSGTAFNYKHSATDQHTLRHTLVSLFFLFNFCYYLKRSFCSFVCFLFFKNSLRSYMYLYLKRSRDTLAFQYLPWQANSRNLIIECTGYDEKAKRQDLVPPPPHLFLLIVHTAPARQALEGQGKRAIIKRLRRSDKNCLFPFKRFLRIQHHFFLVLVV